MENPIKEEIVLDVNVKESKKKRPRVVTTISSSVPEDGAFAKLEGRNLNSGDRFCAYVTEMPCLLGRRHESQPKKGFISLGSSKTISRIHAVLGFDEKTNNYYLEPRGRNCITVRKVQHQSETQRGNRQDPYSTEQLGKRVKISSRDPIRIGDIGFYFLKSVR